MGTSGYTIQSIGSKIGHRTERYSGGPRMGKYSTEKEQIYQSINVESYKFVAGQKPHFQFECGVPNLFFGGYRHGDQFHLNAESSKVIFENFVEGNL